MKNMSDQTRTMTDKIVNIVGKRNLMNVGLSAIALLIAFLIANHWLSEPARPSREAREVQAKLVDVVPVHYGHTEPLIQLHGEVIAAMAISLYSQVDGNVVATDGDLAPGTLVDRGQLLAKIDDIDYRLAVQRAEASFATSHANYQQELGEQAVANRELNLLTGQLNTELSEQQRQLILRQPQLAQAQAEIDSSRASLEAAKLDLARTEIRAPFAGIISNKYIDLGSQVSSSRQVVDLIDTTTFWIKISLPTDYLNHFTFASDQPNTGSKVKIIVNSNGDKTRIGEVYKRLPELNDATRQAQILVRLDDPLALKPENKGKPQLMVNDYVAVEIIGNTLNDVMVLDANLIHNGNQIWTNSDGVLKIHTIDILWREQERIIARGNFKEGDLIVATNIANAYDGLKITSEREASSTSQSTEARTGGKS
jgi:RND family efflux transporter MFP subunit